MYGSKENTRTTNSFHGKTSFLDEISDTDSQSDTPILLDNEASDTEKAEEKASWLSIILVSAVTFIFYPLLILFDFFKGISPASRWKSAIKGSFKAESDMFSSSEAEESEIGTYIIIEAEDDNETVVNDYGSASDELKANDELEANNKRTLFIATPKGESFPGATNTLTDRTTDQLMASSNTAVVDVTHNEAVTTTDTTKETEGNSTQDENTTEVEQPEAPLVTVTDAAVEVAQPEATATTGENDETKEEAIPAKTDLSTTTFAPAANAAIEGDTASDTTKTANAIKETEQERAPSPAPRNK